MKWLSSIPFLLLASALPSLAAGPAFDNSGNGLLKGTYYFREVLYVVADGAGDLSRGIALYGNIVFDGNGGYSTTNASVVDSSSGSIQPLSVTGTYTVSASGYGYLSSPISSGDAIYGLVANGIFVGSTTETSVGFNDMFVAAPLGSPAPTNASFQGSYTMAGFLPGGQPQNAGDVFFQLNPDGQGNLGTVNVPGYYGGGSTTPLTQTSAKVTYKFSNGGAVVTFPTSSTAPWFSGQEFLYFSPDGNFVFGGAPNSFDMLVGVKNGATGSTQTLSGLYYQAGIDQDVSTLAGSGYATLDTFYGGFSAGSGVIVAADRLLSAFNVNAYGSTYSDTYPTSISGGAYTTAGITQFAVANGGAIRIGAGIWPYLGLSVALQAPTLTGSGVFLNPAGIANAASSAPFTAGVANGELITLYGSNLAPSTTVASTVPFPTTLGGVQVMMNGIPAAIYYVSPTQISAIVPFGNPYSILKIQVVNNGAPSNAVTQFVNKTTAGVFTYAANGLGYAAAVHNATGALVTQKNPALPGEYLQVFLTGLGTVLPPVQDGAAGPSDTLSQSIYFSSDSTQTQLAATVGNVSATVTYAGLAPTLAGLYQINLLVPAASAGDRVIAISGPDSYTAEALLPIGSGSSTSASAPAPAAQRPARMHAAPQTPKLTRTAPLF